jgi:chromosome segregation ATPase
LAREDAERRRRQQRASWEDEMSRLDRDLERVTNQLHDAERAVADTEALLDEKRSAKRQAESSLSQIEKKLRTFKSTHSQGNQPDSTSARIQKAHGFSFPPIGPVSQYVKLKDQQWGLACEHIVGKMLTSFIVNTSRDEEILRKILPRNTQIVTMDFTRPRNREDNSPPTRDARSVFDMLTFVNKDIRGERMTVNAADVVANMLMDICHADRVWCIDSEEEAREVGWGGSATAILKNGCQYRKQNNIQVRLGATRRECRIGVDEGDRIRYLERDERNAQQRVDAVSEEYRAIEERFRREKAEKNKFDRNRSDLLVRKRKLEIQMEDPRDDIDDFDAQVNTLKGRIASKRKEKETKEKNIPVLEERVAQLRKDKSQYVSRIEKLSAELNAADDLKRENDEKFALKRQTELELDKEKKALNHLKERESTQVDVVGMAKNEAEQKLAKARKHSGERELQFRTTARSTGVIINVLKEERQKYEEAQKLANLNFAKVRMEYQTAKENLDRAIRYIKELEDYLTVANQGLQARKDKYTLIQSSLTRRTKMSFLDYVRKRRFVGKLKFDHGSKKLDIKVKPLSAQSFIDVAGLSGGEKSYSLVALLLSLWDVMECPFYCIDEFDVFMDVLNRQMATKLLVDGAEVMSNRQFIYITPLGLDDMSANPWVRVYEVTE